MTPLIPDPESAGLAVTDGTDSTNNVPATIRINKKETTEANIDFSFISATTFFAMKFPSSLPAGVVLHFDMFLRIAQRANVMHYVPSLLRRHRSRERRHWSAVEAGFQITKHIAIRVSTFELPAAGEIERWNQIALAIGQRRCRGSVTTSVFSMALPAIHALEKSGSAFYAFGRIRRFSRNRYDCAGFLFFKRRGKCLDISDQVGALLPQQRLP